MSDDLLLPDQCIKVTFASVLTVISPAGRRKMLLRFLPCQIQGLDPLLWIQSFLLAMTLFWLETQVHSDLAVDDQLR